MITYSIIFAMLAGFMNGTYAFPLKYMTRWSNETSWLVFSPLAFLLMPWLCLFLLDNNIFTLLNSIPNNSLYILLLAGLLFGIGMITFTFSLRFVGIGISFILNISTGTMI